MSYSPVKLIYFTILNYLFRNGQDACSTKLNFIVERVREPVLNGGATPIQTKNLSKPARHLFDIYFPAPALTSVQARSYNAVVFPTSCKNFILASTSAGG